MAHKFRSFALLLAALLLFQMAFATFAPSAGTRVYAAGGSGPLLLGKLPADNAENVAANANLVLTFDEDVTRGTGSAAVTIRRVADNSVVDTFVVSTDSRVSISSATPNVVTIDPTANLTANTPYYVLVDAGAFRGPTGVNYAGISSATEWNFTVGSSDTAAPVLVDRTTTINSGMPFAMIFNEQVFAASGTITITNISDPTDMQVLNVVSPSVTGSGTTTISVLPPAALRPGSTYNVTVTGNAFQDSSGNGYAGVSGGWQLTIGAPPMGVIDKNPTATTIVSSTAPTPLVLQFALNVVKGDGTKKVVIRRLSDNSEFQTYTVDSGAVQASGNVVTITPSIAFAPNTGYYVLIEAGAFKDAATGTVLFQGFADASDWYFTTSPVGDTVKPVVTERIPADNAVQNALKFPLELKFSEPVYPGSGSIVIKNAQNDLPVETIPVTSIQVTGGGTATIKVTPAVSFINNGNYYVQISNGAFRDAAGNTFAGETDKTIWNFTTTQDAVVPTITAFSPASGTMSVPTNGTFTITFSEPIQLVTDNIVIRRSSSSSTGSIATTAAVDPADSKKLVITPLTALTPSTSYYMEIPAGAVKDLGGNDFGGILNVNTYRFGTVGSDSSAPQLSSAVMSGSTKIVLNYNEALKTDDAFVPATGSFYVTVNDASRAVTAVAVSGQTVTLTLQSGVVSGQTVKVYYTQPSGTRAIQDLSGNKAASINGTAVTNTPDNTLPAPTSASVNGSIVTVMFNEDLQAISANANTQFIVTINGEQFTPATVVSNGSMVSLTLNTSVTAGSQVVSLSYSAGSYPLRDLTGNLVTSFSGYPVRNGLDATAPVIQSAVAAGNTVTLTFNEPLDPNSKPAPNRFNVLADSASRTVTAVNLNSSQVVLTLNTSVTTGQTVTVGYSGGTPALKDAAGNLVGAFSNYPVVNNGTTPGAVALTSAIARGPVITLSFSQSLRTTNLPQGYQFLVRVNGSVRSVTNVSVSGATALLTLNPAISAGDSATVSYVASSSAGLYSTSGEAVASFTEYAVSNLTTGLEQMSGDLENAAGGGVALKAGTATTSSGRSTTGESVIRYAVKGDKLSTAFTAVKLAFPNSPRVVFPVPATNAAAVVDVPLQQLETAGRLEENAVFGVQYKDMTFEIPLSALDYAEIRRVGGNGNSLNLTIEADSGADSATAELRSVLSAKRLQPIGSPMHFHIYATNGSTSNEVTAFKGYLTRTLTSTTKLDEDDTAVVWLDPETETLSYVPTKITGSGSGSMVTFRRMGNSAYALVKGSVTYGDIRANHWARADIMELSNKFIVEGRTSRGFEPDKPITRGEFAAYIARGLGLSGDREAAKKFKDVANSTVMAAYIGAAANANIVAGVSADKFQPNSPITREQMAAMMVRAAKFAGKEVVLNKDEREYLRPFKDNGSVTHRSDVAKAIEAKIMNGISSTKFSPKANATRAQAAVMIKRMLEYVDFI